MRVVITTIVTLNPGDAAILEGSLVLLREAFGEDLAVTVFDNDGTTAASCYPWAPFRTGLFSVKRWGRIRRWIDRRGYGHRVMALDGIRLRLAARLLRNGLGPAAWLFARSEERESLSVYLKADLVIPSGGTYLVEHYDLLSRILEYETVVALGRPLVFFPQSMGPFRTTVYKKRLRSVFRAAERIFLRDSRSAKHLAELEIPAERITVVGDAAFALVRDSSGRGASKAVGRPRIAVSVREWLNVADEDPSEARRRYLKSVAAAVTEIIRQCEARVTFLSTCQGIPQYWTDDSRVADEVVALLPEDVAPAVEVDRSFRQPSAILQTFAAFDGVVATRMHAAILATCAGVPSIGIAYEFKTAELFQSLGLEQWAVDIRTLEPGPFSELVVRFVRELGSLQSATRAGAMAQAARLRTMVPLLRSLARPSEGRPLQP